MHVVISPAKTLDYKNPLSDALEQAPAQTEPGFLQQSEQLVELLRKKTPTDLSSLMKLSAKLSELNFERYINWRLPLEADKTRPCIFAFRGDVYTGLDVDSMSGEDLAQAQKKLRILSGLYGVLKPLDRMLPYRLEMGTKLVSNRGKDLYAFWGSRLVDSINSEVGDGVLVNLASNEYFKSIARPNLQARVVTPVFKDQKNGIYKIISFHAKKARGLMTSWILRNRIETVSQLEQFVEAGYYFCPEQSAGDTLVFLRDEQTG